MGSFELRLYKDRLNWSPFSCVRVASIRPVGFIHYCKTADIRFFHCEKLHLTYYPCAEVFGQTCWIVNMWAFVLFVQGITGLCIQYNYSMKRRLISWLLVWRCRQNEKNEYWVNNYHDFSCLIWHESGRSIIPVPISSPTRRHFFKSSIQPMWHFKLCFCLSPLGWSGERVRLT